MDNEQPTADQISQAWTYAIEAENIGGARSQTLIELKELRDKKTTWCGKYENDLRFSVDRYLESKFPVASHLNNSAANTAQQ